MLSPMHRGYHDFYAVYVWLRIIRISLLATHTEIHRQAERALPDAICLYRNEILAFKLLRQDLCDDEYMLPNFQISNNERETKWDFWKDKTLNILSNRLHIPNNKIEKNLFNLSLETYKLKCKDLFLKT